MKELCETVSDLKEMVSELSPDQLFDLSKCSTHVVVSALIQALKLKQLVLDKEVKTPVKHKSHTETPLAQTGTETGELRKKLAAVKKKLYCLENMPKDSDTADTDRIKVSDGKVNGDLNTSADVFSDSVIDNTCNGGSSLNAVVVESDSDSDVTVDLDDVNNSAREKETTRNLESPELDWTDSTTGSAKKKYKFTPIKSHVDRLSPVLENKIVNRSEDIDSDDTDDLENFDNYNLDDLASSTPSVKVTSQKDGTSRQSHDKGSSPEVCMLHIL